MSDHDPLCMVDSIEPQCICYRLRLARKQARDAERLCIAQAVVDGIGSRVVRNDATNYQYGYNDGWRDGMQEAARIARQA